MKVWGVGEGEGGGGGEGEGGWRGLRARVESRVDLHRVHERGEERRAARGGEDVALAWLG